MPHLNILYYKIVFTSFFHINTHIYLSHKHKLLMSISERLMSISISCFTDDLKAYTMQRKTQMAMNTYQNKAHGLMLQPE